MSICENEPHHDPWPEKRVQWLNVDLSLAAELDSSIANAADERPIQRFFECHPVLLVQLLTGGHGRWVFPQPRLVSYIPDFLLCEKNSGGYQWTMVELENPTYPALTGNGQQSAKLTHALTQISDWRNWLRSNALVAQGTLGFKQLDCSAKGVVVIGRREMVEAKHRERYRELSQNGVEVMSYDRLSERVRAAAEAHVQLLRDV